MVLALVEIQSLVLWIKVKEEVLKNTGGKEKGDNMSASGFKNPTDGSPCYVIHNAFNEEHCKKFIEILLYCSKEIVSIFYDNRKRPSCCR